MSLPHQDWKTVVLHKQTSSKKGTAGVKTDTAHRPFKSNLTRAQREAIESDGPRKIERVSKSMSQKIQQARAEKGLTRKQLAQRVNQSINVIADYENGKAIPKPGLINKMERILGCRLR